MSEASIANVAEEPPVRDSKTGRWLRGKAKPSEARSRAMLGNTNGSLYPWRVYWRRRALGPAERWVLGLVAGYDAELIQDKGGDSEVTAAERRLIETAAAARVCWLLAIATPTEGSRAEAAKFMAVERQCLQAIGLERRAKRGPSLAELLVSRPGVPATPRPPGWIVKAQEPSSDPREGGTSPEFGQVTPGPPRAPEGSGGGSEAHDPLTGQPSNRRQ